MKEGIHEEHTTETKTLRKRETKNGGKTHGGNCVGQVFSHVTLYSEHAGGTRKHLTVFNEENTGNNHNKSLHKTHRKQVDLTNTN